MSSRPRAASRLIYIDRHLVHEVTSPQAFEGLRLSGRKVRAPEKTLAVVDHNIQTTDRSGGIEDPESRAQVEELAKNAREFGIEYYDEFDRRQGIVHIIGPEQGFTLPGTTIVCGDSHTSTHGAFGALAHGIGTSEVEHVLATQTLIQSKAKNMRVKVDGALPPGVTAKDIILAIIGEIGTAGGTGHVIEYCGSAIESLSMEGRMTVCNMSIEGGARAGMIAPDEKTYAYLKDRPKSPKGELWDQARRHWDTLRSDEGAHFDREVKLNAADLPPIVSWGTSPQDVAPIVGVVPRVEDAPTEQKRASIKRVARLYGAERRGEDHGHRHRPRLHRLLHQRPHRGSARRGDDRQRPQGQRARQRHGRAGLGPGQGAGRGRGSRQDLPRRGLRVARARLLDVPCDEPRQARARRALRLDLEPQFRGPPGLQGPHPSGVAGDGGGGGDRGPVRRCAGVALSAMKAGDLLIDEREIVESFVRASGPGGQNVNKVASAVELRFDARRSPSLPNDVAIRLIKLAGARATQDGVIVIFAQRYASQPRNREDARARLAELIMRAQARAKPRVATRPTLASRVRRVDEKTRRGAVKALRGKATGSD